MLQCKKMLSVFGCVLLISTNLLAGDITLTTSDALPIGNFKIGIGSTMNLKTSDTALAGEAVFLGNILTPSGVDSYRLYLKEKSKKIYYVESDHFARKNSELQTVVDPYEQVGGTCTGYAINSFLSQTNASGFIGTGVLFEELLSEEGRSQLLAHAINEYYLTPRYSYSIKRILNNYGKKYGFTCDLMQTEVYEEAKDYILRHLDKGYPVVVSFNIGPKMVDSPFALEMYKNAKIKLDPRLWIPRKVGERNSGGHTIVAAGSFKVKDKTYLVMLDSDWSHPRVWDMDAYLNDKKTALSEVEFITCE